MPAVLCLLLAAWYRPWVYGGAPVRPLDIALGVYALLTAAQLLPLPPAVTGVAAPALRPTMTQLDLVVPAWLPLSVDARSTAVTFLVNAALTIVFLAARRIFRGGGVRLVARGVALMGLLLSLIALAQDQTGHGLMYWTWKPLTEGAFPFGPFVNRNHFATWVVMATPFTLGYLAAHSGAHGSRPAAPLPLRRRIVLFFDGRAILLTASACVMVVALVATLSRSGWFGMSVSAALGVVFRRRGGRGVGSGRAWWWIAAAAAGAILLLAASMRADTIIERLARTHVSVADRLTIWTDTVPMVRDFWLTGTGAGTYETAMLVYQRASPGVRFNEAHNHYLQIAAEGGVMLGVPLAVAFVLYLRQARRRMAAEHSGMFWIRAGALCGLGGAAAQSVWDTGLSIPANAALACVLAAIVIHEPRRH
ncbi:MAG TPA: O-antigen ligase family protein [Vicinamibacterales bacterium]